MQKLSFLLPVVFAAALVSCGDGDGLMSAGPTWDKAKEVTLTIESIEPQVTEAGKTVMLQGRGLDATLDTVMLGNDGVEPDGSGDAGTEPTAAAGSQTNGANKMGTIIFTVPKDVDVGEVEVKVKREETLSNSVTLEIEAAAPVEDESAEEDEADDEDVADDADDDAAADDTAHDDRRPIGRLTFKRDERMDIMIRILQMLKRKGIDPATLGNN